MRLHVTFLAFVTAAFAFTDLKPKSGLHDVFKVFARMDPLPPERPGNRRPVGSYDPNRRPPTQSELQSLSQSERNYWESVRNGHLQPTYQSSPHADYITDSVGYGSSSSHAYDPPAALRDQYRHPPTAQRPRGQPQIDPYYSTPAMSRPARAAHETPQQAQSRRAREREIQNFRRHVGPYEELDPGVPSSQHAATVREAYMGNPGYYQSTVGTTSQQGQAQIGSMSSSARGYGSVGLGTGNPTGGHSTPAAVGIPRYTYYDARGNLVTTSYPPPYGTDYTVSRRKRNSRSRRTIAPIEERNDVLGSISSTSSQASDPKYAGKPFSDQTTEFQLYMNVYKEIQANVSDLLFPYFDTVLNNTNNSLIYDLVWSVYSDLVADGPFLIGPYSNGMTCFDWMEHQAFPDIFMANSTGNSTGNNTSISTGNSTADSDHIPTYNATVAAFLLTDGILIDIYTAVWGNATQIANQTGYLSQMDTLRQYLSPANASIIPSYWNEKNTLSDTGYFTVYNQTMHI